MNHGCYGGARAGTRHALPRADRCSPGVYAVLVDALASDPPSPSPGWSGRRSRPCSRTWLGGKALPAEVVQHIVAKTDGVPLYVEELTRRLHQQIVQLYETRFPEVMARHCTAAGQDEAALVYWQQAGQHHVQTAVNWCAEDII